MLNNMTRMPAIFLGHGNPMNALENNAYTDAWRRIGETMAKPRGIVCVSAHWYRAGTHITDNPRPPTIHDFGGFPKALFEVEYPAPGAPALAQEIQRQLLPVDATLDSEWGLDHGTWSVLCHVFPHADVPVVQLSIDRNQPPAFHFELGKKLAPLRDEGILVMGSGNLVHNLRAYSWDRGPVDALDWAVRFEAQAKSLMDARDFAPLVDYPSLGRDAMLAAPTPDHYLPLLYILALLRPDEPITYPVQGFEGGSISMLSVQAG